MLVRPCFFSIGISFFSTLGLGGCSLTTDGRASFDSEEEKPTPTSTDALPESDEDPAGGNPLGTDPMDALGGDAAQQEPDDTENGADGGAREGTGGGNQANGDTTTNHGTSASGGASSKDGSSDGVTSTDASSGGTANSGSSSGGTANSGSSSGGAADGDSAASGGSPAVVPPMVEHVEPADGSAGVASNTALELRFSAAMNRASVEHSFAVEGFEAFKLEFDWMDDRTLVVRAKDGFAYAEGTDSEWTEALEYHWSLSAQAQDADGVSLGRETRGSFSTLRRIQTRWTPRAASRTNTYSHGQGSSPLACPDSDPTIEYFSTSSAAGTGYTFVAYDAADLDDAAAIVDIEAVHFRVAQLGQDESFYDDAVVVFERLEEGDPLDRSVMDLNVVQDMGLLTSTAASLVNVDITSDFPWDRGVRTFVYRLKHEGTLKSGARAHFDCDGFALEMTYLLP